MTKSRFNLRNGIAIIAICLAGVTMFSSCGKGNGENENEYKGGNLVLEDGYAWVSGDEGSRSGWIFKSDGVLQLIYEYDFQSGEGLRWYNDLPSAGSTWSASGNKATIYITGWSAPRTISYTATSTTLTWEDYSYAGEVWTKAAVTMSKN